MTDMLPSELIEMDAELAGMLAVPAPRADFSARLRTQIMSTADLKPAARPGRIRLVQRLALGLPTAIVIVILLLGPQHVLAAFKRWFGYLPGIGLVEDGFGIRLLSAPVSAERDGVTVTIENAAADANRTIVVYRVEGLSVTAANSQGEAAPTGSVPTLVLADGTILTSQESSANGWATGYRIRASFPPMPADDSVAALFFHRLPSMPEGAAPQDWSISFTLSPGPADLEVMPVYEIATAEPTISPMVSVSTPDQTRSLADYGVSLSLDTIITLPEGYQFQGYASWPESADIAYVSINPYAIRLSVDGAAVKVEPADPDYPAEAGSATSIAWAVRTNTRTFTGPIAIEFDSVEVTRTTNIPFILDLGADPQVGQLIPADQTIAVDGASVHLNGYQISTLADGTCNLDLFFDAAEPFYALEYQDPENYLVNQGGGGGGGGGIPPAEGRTSFQSSFHYGRIPTGQRQLIISAVTFSLQSESPIVWQPPAEALVSSQATTQSEACLNLSTWLTLRNENQPLPQGISGAILLQRYVVGQPMPRLVLVDLATIAQKEIDWGAWSSLSPDGTQAAYVRSQGDGIYLADVITGQTKVIPGTQSSDYNPIWSPDGQWILFFRGGSTYDYYRVHPDGSDLSLVYHSGLLTQAGDWNPVDGRLIFETLTDQGIILQSIAPDGIDVRDLFSTGLHKPVSSPRVSADGAHLAYRGFEFGDPDFSLLVSAPDGSGKRMLADSSLTVLPGAWSPDGRWLLATVVYQQGQDQIYQPVVVDPQTCQVFILTGVTGQVTGWSP